MDTFEGKRGSGRPTEPRPPAAKPMTEAPNEDFEKRYGRRARRRVELIRFTAIAKFMGRWSAP